MTVKRQPTSVASAISVPTVERATTTHQGRTKIPARCKHDKANTVWRPLKFGRKCTVCGTRVWRFWNLSKCLDCGVIKHSGCVGGDSDHLLPNTDHGSPGLQVEIRPSRANAAGDWYSAGGPAVTFFYSDFTISNPLAEPSTSCSDVISDLVTGTTFFAVIIKKIETQYYGASIVYVNRQSKKYYNMVPRPRQITFKEKMPQASCG